MSVFGAARGGVVLVPTACFWGRRRSSGRLGWGADAAPGSTAPHHPGPYAGVLGAVVVV